MTPIKCIREKCLDCVCGSAREVRLCPSETCPLWPYRMGVRPSTLAKRQTSKNYELSAVFSVQNETLEV